VPPGHPGFDELQHRNRAELRELRNHIHQAGNNHLLEQGHSGASSRQHPNESAVQEWKAEMVAHAHQMALMRSDTERATEGSDDDGRKKSATSQETMPLYHMPGALGDHPDVMRDDSHMNDSRMSGQADGYAADASTGDMEGHTGEENGLAGVPDVDGEGPQGRGFPHDGEFFDGQAALEDLEQRHLILQQAGLPSICEQPDRDESDTSGTVTGNLAQEHDSNGGVAPPASTQAASHTAGTAGTDIFSTASLPGGLTFLNAGTPPNQGNVNAMPPTNPHYNLTASSTATSNTVPTSAAPKSINNDPFSNVWQQLQQRPPSVQLLSLSSTVAGGPGGGGPASTGAHARIHDNTSQMADLRLEIEKLRKELSEEKAAHQALQHRTLELRTRLAQSSYEPSNRQSPGDMDNTDVAQRFKSLVERNPVIVDSFWVNVDEGVSARLDVAEYTGLGKLKFSSRLFDNRAVKEWYKKNKHRVEVGSLLSGLAGANMPLTTASGPSTAQSFGVTNQSSYPGEATTHSTLPEVARISDQSGKQASDQSKVSDRRVSDQSARRFSEVSDAAGL
jgi:hypothetical protein